MKKFPVDENCIAFDTREEFLAAFQVLAGEEELTDDTVVEGNSGLKFDTVKEWVHYFGLEHVYFGDSFKHGFVEEFYFNLKNAGLKGLCWVPCADEIYIKDGFLRLWFD
jgi:hypothetical protein